jgi:mycothiol synthase
MTMPAVRTFTSGDETGIRRVMEASLAVDALPGIDARDIERSLLQVRAEPQGTAVALEGGEVVGYCTPRHDILTVHPGHRRRGHGRRLIEAARDIVRSAGLDELILHGPTHLPATSAFLDALGFRYHSSLWRFALDPEATTPAPSFPAGFAVRSFRESDLSAYVALMNASFVDHPTPLSWTERGVRDAHARPSFDPEGILLVTLADRPHHLVAFTRTRLDPAGSGPGNLALPAGEIALVGVQPEWRGRGLGRELLRWGVAHLRRRGAATVTLSVQSLNEGATRIYRAAGFRPEIEWPQFALAVDRPLP